MPFGMNVEEVVLDGGVELPGTIIGQVADIAGGPLLGERCSCASAS